MTETTAEVAQFREQLKSRATTRLPGVKRWYSPLDTAKFFGRTSTWIYNRLDKKLFTYEDGTPIDVKTVGSGPRPRMRFDLETIKAMAESCYRDGILGGLNELEVIYERVARSEAGEKVTTDDYS
jgi:hypothetical protein